MIARLDHLNIVVGNLAEATAFFRLLGFEEGLGAALDAPFLERVTGIAGARGHFVTLRHPGSELALELLQFAEGSGADPLLGRADRIGLRHLAFAVADIEATVARLAAAGIPCLTPVQTWHKTGKKLVYFHGPDDILLELAEYPRP